MAQIENIEIRFSGSANFKEVYAEAAKLNAQLKAMQGELAKLDDKAVRDLRSGFNMRVRDMGGVYSESVKAKTATQAFTESLIKQDVTIAKAYKNRKLFNDVLREQYQLQKMVAVQWGRGATGTVTADVMIPKGASDEVNRLTKSFKANAQSLVSNRLEMLRHAAGSKEATAAAERFAVANNLMHMRMGIATDTMASMSANMVKWGKNTQWAGRQLMVGFTVPFLAFAAAAGVAANTVDKEMTRILKVYDFSAESMKDAGMREAEANNLRVQSLNAAKDAARRYGVQVQDTLEIEAELAATGMRGNDLVARTAVLNKAMIMGELDKQQAIKASTALQTTYGHSTEQINQDFEYMANIANATSVSMSDFVEGLPRGAQVLKNAGVDIKQLGVLMVALKQNSIATGEGINGLRTIAQRLVSVTPKAQKVWSELLPQQKTIQEFVDQNEGQLLPTLTQLGEAMKSLSVYQKQQILTELFGKQRLNIGLAVMDAITNKSGQMVKALDVANMTVAENAQVAANSLAQVTNSASNRVARAVATIKAEMADMGATFLPLAASLISGVSGILKWFNSLGESKKHIIIWGAALAAAIGVGTMFVGLLSNLIGTIAGAITSFSKLGLKFRTTTVEQRAQAMMAEKSAAIWRDQGLAAQTLSAQLKGLVGRLDEVGMAQERNALKQLTGGGQVSVYQGKQPGMPGPNYPAGTAIVRNGNTVRKATREEALAQRNLDHTAALAENEQRMAASSTVTKRNWGAIAGSTAAVATTGAIMAASFGSSDDASKNIMNNMMNILMAATLLGPTLSRGFGKVGGSTALKGIKEAFSAGKASGGIASGLRAALPVAGSLAQAIAKFAGPVGLLVSAGLLIKGVHDGMENARKKQIEINDSAKQWADILGFTYTAQAKAADKTKSQSAAAVDLAAKFRSANKEATKGLDIAAKSKNQEDLLNAAIQEGIKVRMHGGDAGQARLATATALAAAGKNDAQIQDLMVQVDAKINFKDLKQVAAQQGTIFGETFTKMATDKIQADNWFTRIWESRNNDITAGAKQAGVNMSKEIWNALESAPDPQSKKEYFDKVQKDFESQTSGLMADLKKNSTAGMLNSSLDWSQVAAMAQNDRSFGPNDLSPFKAMFTKEQQDAILKYARSEREVVQGLAQERGIAPDVAKNLNTMKDLRKALGIANLSTAEAQAKYNDEIETAKRNGLPLNDKEQLLVLNRWRGQAGLGGATEVAQGFGEALQGASGAVDQFGQKIDASIMTAEEWGQAWTDATKNAMSGAQGQALDQAENLRAQQQSDIMESIDKKYQAQLDAADAAAEKKNAGFDRRAEALDKKADAQSRALDAKQKARQKAISASWDARIQKVQDAIDAEQKAEDIRQKIFDAEKERLNRLAQMQNMNIDFNVAVNTGNLDTAAKTFNDMQAQQNDWATSDAAGASQTASEARKEALGKQKDSLDKAKDAALEALKTKEDAENRALKDKQDREKKALAAEKDRYAKSVEANKKAIQDQQNAEKKANEAFLADKKHTLDMELAAIRASTPRNKAEYDAQIKQIEAAYSRYGINLKAQGNTWTKYIGDYLTSNVAASAKSLQNDINWKSYAASIANDFTTGAFNMTVAEFGKWITTGKAPSDAFSTPKSPTANSTQGKAHSTGSHAVKGAHTGGYLGGSSQNLSQRNRLGVALSSDLMPSETHLIAKKDEYVMSGKAVNKFGVDTMDQINSGQLPIGGANIGLAGIIAGGLAAQMKNAMQMGVLSAAMRKVQEDGMPGSAVSAKTGAAGKYGKISLNAEQLRNAAAIMATGKSMGASNRDLTIALMTAMQESTLRNLNYGDADSLGLFQQRPSQGWGTAEQIMNPSYSASKFFKALFGVKGRDKMPMTLAAQAVQRSAFPYAYAKWQDMASSLVNGTTFSSGAGMGIEGMLAALQGVGTAGSTGKWSKPLDAYRVSSEYGMRVNPVTGVYKLHDGIDLAAAGGTPIHAADGGRVVSAGAAGGYGNYTVIQHGNGMMTGYAHQSRLNVKAGQAVRKGQLIGAVGTTGNSTGNHLHFQMGKGAGAWKNPRDFIPGLRKGGYTLNDGYAMLHKNETVLTADLSQQLKQGLSNLATGSNSQYNVTVDLRGAYVNKEIDIEKAINTALDRRESKMGRNRKVSA